MTARLWHGAVPADRADAYHDVLLQTGVPDYRTTPGNRGVHVLWRTEGDLAHVQVLTLWDDLDAVRAFAGDDVERARYYPEDDPFLVEKEPLIAHYEVGRPPPPAWPGPLVRLWRGWTSPTEAEAYETLLRSEILPAIAARRLDGYRGAVLLRREGTEEVEFMTALGFDSADAVRAFAAGDPETAVVPTEARALLIRLDTHVHHYDVRTSTGDEV